MMHPWHSHGYVMKIVERDGRPLGSAAFECDTLGVNPGERYDALITVDRPGVWAFHCHILPHVEAAVGHVRHGQHPDRGARRRRTSMRSSRRCSASAPTDPHALSWLVLSPVCRPRPGAAACTVGSERWRHGQRRLGPPDVGLRPADGGVPRRSPTIRPGGRARRASRARRRASVEMHETSTDQSGMTGMQPIARIDVGAGATVRLEPGGMHLMIIGLDRDRSGRRPDRARPDVRARRHDRRAGGSPGLRWLQAAPVSRRIPPTNRYGVRGRRRHPCARGRAVCAVSSCRRAARERTTGPRLGRGRRRCRRPSPTPAASVDLGAFLYPEASAAPGDRPGRP